MKYIFTCIAFMAFHFTYAQITEEINVPKGIVYNYCDPKVLEKAKDLVYESITDSTKYLVSDKILIVGPQLWTRFKDIPRLSEIEGGRTVFHVGKEDKIGKVTQRLEDAKKVWDEFRKDIKGKFTIRKANEDELKYYWSVISFDIDEPLLIVETKEHNYILNLIKKDLKLMWLDEAPVKKK
jgi:RNAse (barnase) inhibitor barstar